MSIQERDLADIWALALKLVQPDIKKLSFDTILKNSSLESLDGNTALVKVQNDFAKDWLATRYTDKIEDALRGLVGKVPIFGEILSLSLHELAPSELAQNDVGGVVKGIERGETMLLNLGPSHPAAHGTLRNLAKCAVLTVLGAGVSLLGAHLCRGIG